MLENSHSKQLFQALEALSKILADGEAVLNIARTQTSPEQLH